MRANPLLRVLFVCAAIALASDVTHACSCGPKPPVLSSYERAHAVVIARLTSIDLFKNQAKAKADEEQLRDSGIATFLIEKVYKGKLRVNQEFKAGAAPNAACFWSFYGSYVNRQFLLYMFAVDETGDGWWASTCDRTRGIEYATEDLLYLDNMEKLRGKTRVSGSYRAWLGQQLDDVANKRIRIIGEKETFETKTDSKGVFEIYDLPAGEYSLEPEVPKGWAIMDSSKMASTKSLQFTIDAKKHTTVNVELAPTNAVEGTVVGPDGNPMHGVCAHLQKPDQVGDDTRFDCTDKEGHFRIGLIPAGSYLVVLNPDGKPSSDELYPRLFYPSVTQRERAALITVANGETVKGINFVISSLAETVTVSGVLLFFDGKPAAEELVTFAPPNSKDDKEAEVETTDTEGRFTLKIVKGLKGEIRGDFQANVGEYLKCPKLDALIKATGREFAEVHSPPIKIEADQDIENVVLRFTFPRCKRKED